MTTRIIGWVFPFSDFILNVEGPLQAGSKVVLTKRPRDCDVDADDDMESTLADELIQENE